MKTILIPAIALCVALFLPAQQLQTIVPDTTPVAAPDTQSAVSETPGRIDTVYVFKDSVIQVMVKNWKGKIDKSRRQGFGGAGGWTPMVIGVSLSPVNNLIATDIKVKRYGFNLPGTALMVGSGGMGYGGIGNGIRIGGAGYSGSQRYTSKTGVNDSLMRLNIDVSWGGLIVEKVFVRDRFNLIAGGLIGGGSYAVTAKPYKSAEPSAFDLDLSKNSEGETAEAPFTALSVYGGFTYTMVSWFHVGADAGLTAFYSHEGFGSNSFATGAGAVRLRLIWGNLG